MNSMLVGMMPCFMIKGTTAIACWAVANGTKRLEATLGTPSSLIVALVMIPSVPSLPMYSCFKSYPLTSLVTFPPSSTMSPCGVTTSIPKMYRPVTPYLTAFPPPAFSAILPPRKQVSRLIG